MITANDGRYTVTLEHTGSPTARYVARFCGDWIGESETEDYAKQLCDRAYALRMYGFTEHDVDAMAQGYIECAAWSSSDMPDDEPDENKYESLEDFEFSDDATLSLESDCIEFLCAHPAMCREATDANDYSFSRLGHDLWLTRNDHGAGFWDRDELRTDDDDEFSLGRRLTDVVGYGTEFKPADIYLNRETMQIEY